MLYMNLMPVTAAGYTAQRFMGANGKICHAYIATVYGVHGKIVCAHFPVQKHAKVCLW